jgi:hypothetical protein
MPGPAILVSRVLPKFLDALRAVPHPVVVDLGPVVGPNVAFFGERLGCKIIVEDVCAEVDRAARSGATSALPVVFRERFAPWHGAADGVLCWDVFDALDRAAAEALARAVVEALRPGGAVLGWFATTATPPGHHTRFVVLDERRLELRPYAAAGGRRRVWQSREIMQLFTGLEMTEQVLLKTNRREVLFRNVSAGAVRRA